MENEHFISCKSKNFIKMTAVSLFLTIFILLFAAPAAAMENIPEMLVPMGNTVGIDYLFDGVVVLDVTEFETSTGSASPAKEAGIKPGDIITMIDGQEICSAEDIKEAAAEFCGETVPVQIQRNDKEMQMSLLPQENIDGKYEIGVWLRDRIAGMGTLTFYNPQNGEFGALGHPVSDVDTGISVPLREGTILQSHVFGVLPGKPGTPGQIQGDLTANEILGTILQNTDSGIYGCMNPCQITQEREAFPVGTDSDITTGAAEILSDVAGKGPEYYTVEISRVYRENDGDNRDMMFTVTDERLISITGGIIQGMSGSPILQNGKIIGAVTHVLINNPEKGYGISINTMLDAAA